MTVYFSKKISDLKYLELVFFIITMSYSGDAAAFNWGSGLFYITLRKLSWHWSLKLNTECLTALDYDNDLPR